MREQTDITAQWDHDNPVRIPARYRHIFNYHGYCAYYFKQNNERIAQVGGWMEVNRG